MTSLEDVFRACDTRGNGYLEREELHALCYKLKMGKVEADSLFEDLDRDADGRISFKDFVKGFSDFLNISGSDDGIVKETNKSTHSEAPLDTLNRNNPSSEESAKVHFSPKSVTSEALEELLEEMKWLQEENKRLEENWTREKREHERHLRRLELELDNQVQQIEIQATKKAQAEAEEEKKNIRQQMDAEMDQMQANLLLFEKVGSFLNTNKDSQLDSKLMEVRNKLEEASQENRQLRMTLMDSQTNMALLRSEIAHLRSQHEEKCRELSSEREKSLEALHEQDYVSRQFSILQEANKRLQDTNDSLRVALEAAASLTQPNRSCYTYFLQAKRGSVVGDYLRQDLNRRCRSAVDNVGDRSDQWETGSNKSKPKSEDLDMMTYRMQRFVKELAYGQFAHHSDSGQSTMREPDDPEDEERKKQFELCSEKDVSFTGCDSASQVCQTVCGRQLSRNLSSPPDLGSTVIEPVHVPSQPKVQVSYEATGPPERTYKVIFIGDVAVGKSSFILRLAKGNFIPNTSSTLGVDFQVRTLRIDDKNVALQLWDTAGQERFRSITKSYFRKADGIMLLYDCTNEGSFLNVAQWIHAVKEDVSSNVPVVLVANKTDLRMSVQAKGCPIVLQNEGQKLAETQEAKFIECSVKSGINVLEAIAQLVRLMSENEDNEIRNYGMLLKGSAKKKKCCGN